MKEEEKIYLMAELLDEQSIYQLTDELVKAKQEKRIFKYSKYSKVAAVFLGLLIGMGILSLEPVQAAIQKIIYYIPGFGEVIEEKERGYYVLPNEIVRQKEDMAIVIKAATKRGTMLNLRVDIISKQSDSYLEQEIKLLEKGTHQALDKRSHSYRGIYTKDRTMEWECTYEDIEDINEFIIKVGALEIELNLIPIDIDNYNSAKWMGAEDEGYKVSVIPLSDRKDKFATSIEQLDSRGVKANKESADGHIGITRVWDTNGNTYEIDDLYSKSAISGEYKVVGELQEEIDRIEVTEVYWWTQLKENAGQTISLPNPKEGEVIEVNREFDIEGIPYIITHVKGQDDSVIIRWETDMSKDRRINQIDFTIQGGDSEGTSFYGEGVFEEAIKLENRNSKKIKLKVKNYGIIQKGSWIIN